MDFHICFSSAPLKLRPNGAIQIYYYYYYYYYILPTSTCIIM